jgi:hemerythrin-like metal-binding protein
MSFFEWREELETGVDLIDFQHRNLVNMLNNVADAVQGDDFGKELIFEVTLDQLIEYTVHHFATEEKLMIKGDYEHIASHQKMHHALAATAVEFKKRYAEGEKDIGPDLVEFLKTWLNDHIMKVDMAAAPSIKKGESL